MGAAKHPSYATVYEAEFIEKGMIPSSTEHNSYHTLENTIFSSGFATPSLITTKNYVHKLPLVNSIACPLVNSIACPLVNSIACPLVNSVA